MKSKFEINVDDKKVNINITKFSDGTIQMNLGLDAYLRGLEMESFLTVYH